MEPALAPLGLDWRIGIGVLGAFAAREVFVSTLGMVFDIQDADEGSQPLRTALRRARRPDGSRLMTPLSGVALMVFFVIACQCMSTLAVLRRESGSWRWPAFVFTYMTLLAYGSALLVYQAGRVLGWGLA
jgi:ferrous iron transport protein B